MSDQNTTGVCLTHWTESYWQHSIYLLCQCSNVLSIAYWMLYRWKYVILDKLDWFAAGNYIQMSCLVLTICRNIFTDGLYVCPFICLRFGTSFVDLLSKNLQYTTVLCFFPEGLSKNVIGVVFMGRVFLKVWLQMPPNHS